MTKSRVAAVVLAAGMSKRMGPTNKLLVDIGGETMVKRVVNAVLASQVDSVVVVTGHEHERVESALEGLDVSLVHNPGFEEGLASTLRRGVASLPVSVEAAMIVLGDMPKITHTHIDRLLAAYADSQSHDIYVPTYTGRRGNPVLFSRRYFAELASITGDVGGRDLLQTYVARLREVEMDDDAVLMDIDEPGALASLTR